MAEPYFIRGQEISPHTYAAGIADTALVSMNSSSTQGSSKQHPHLSASTLFLVRPPGIVKDGDIIDAFEKSNVGITISPSDIPRRPLEVKHINFPSIALGE